jgi:enhancing lycopene biosynthesis protein 2
MGSEANMARETAEAEFDRRAGKNQSLFRDVNELVHEVNKELGLWVTVSDWVCECADDSCTEQIELSPQQYEEVREQPTHFIVAPSKEHVVVDVEHVVQKSPEYWVVSKVGEAAVVAKHLDPRSRTAR